MSETTKAWWEQSFNFLGYVQALVVPGAVARQIAVAADWDQAPVGSNQEEFPALFPLAAHAILEAATIDKNKY
jgi:hypothetical protein